MHQHLEGIMENNDPIYKYIDRINQIDRILEPSLRSLVSFAEWTWEVSERESPLRGVVRLPLYFPPWISPDRKHPRPGLSATTAICCATLQRSWRRRRRFPWMEEVLEGLAKKLQKNNPTLALPDLLAQAFLPDECEPVERRFLKFLRETRLLGRLRPLLACEMLWTLIHAGEGVAYKGTGFLASFAVLWSLRSSPDRFSAGAAVGQAPPTAYITARCLVPIWELCKACQRRADLLRHILEILEGIEEKLMKKPEAVICRELPFRLDELTTALYDYSEITLARRSFNECARVLEERAGSLNLRSTPRDEWIWVRQRLADAIRQGGEAGRQVAADAFLVVGNPYDEPDWKKEDDADRRQAQTRFFERMGKVLGWAADAVSNHRGVLSRIHSDIDGELAEKKAGREGGKGTQDLDELGVVLEVPEFRDGERVDLFWEDQEQAVRKALKLCKFVFRALWESCDGCARIASEETKGIKGALEQLEAANREVARALSEQIQDSIRWCENVMYREIAHASAGNLAELDPAELVSGLAVTVLARHIKSVAAINDAVEKALEGARQDGSWMPGHPFAIDEVTGFGDLAPTAGIVWMLSGAIARHRDVTAADVALGRYVDWLETTRRSIKLPARADPKHPPLEITGWVSERTLQPGRIDFWMTAFVINTLFNIRGLMEFRLWQLCEQRFTVLRGGKRLSELEPVDLGARHEHRVHRRLQQDRKSTRLNSSHNR
jgi:hypothetical protein